MPQENFICSSTNNLLTIVFALLAIVALSIVVFADAQEITISYVNEQDPTSTTDSLDTGAYEGGKQTVVAGESFTLPSKINNCNYTIYHGIAHKYAIDTITESTCVTPGVGGYVTDCPCGIDYRENAYTTYSTFDTSINNVENEPFGTGTVSLPLSGHTLSERIKRIEYKNGYLNLGTKVFKCLYCEEKLSEEEAPTFPALFVNNGFSYSGTAILQGFAVNFEALRIYKSVNGEIKYGLVVAAASKINSNTLFEGTTLKNGAFSVAFDDKDYSIFEMQVTGLTEDYHETQLFVCAYVIDGDTVTYISNGTEGETVDSVSYNEVVANAEENQTTDIVIKKEEE